MYAAGTCAQCWTSVCWQLLHCILQAGGTLAVDSQWDSIGRRRLLRSQRLGSQKSGDKQTFRRIYACTYDATTGYVGAKQAWQQWWCSNAGHRKVTHGTALLEDFNLDKLSEARCCGNDLQATLVETMAMVFSKCRLATPRLNRVCTCGLHLKCSVGVHTRLRWRSDTSLKNI